MQFSSTGVLIQDHRRGVQKEFLPNTKFSWGSPGKFRVKSSHYRVALSPVLDRLSSDPCCIDFGISHPAGVALWHFREDGGGLPSLCSNKGKWVQLLPSVILSNFFGWICEVDFIKSFSSSASERSLIPFGCLDLSSMIPLLYLFSHDNKQRGYLIFS